MCLNSHDSFFSNSTTKNGQQDLSDPFFLARVRSITKRRVLGREVGIRA